MPAPVRLVKPNGFRKPKKGPKPTRISARTLKHQREEEGLQNLEKKVSEFDPAGIKHFSELPLTNETAKGLKASHFVILTDIQRKAIPLALKCRDILGAARTGSGKTLAFIVPVLEILFRRKWTNMDGLGALIISPTRELAVQIFEVLRQVGRYHTFSAGLVIGGKNVKEEKERLSRMNILVCTPGRMVQHLSETVGFDSNNLQILVLDEADRILDMGFKKSLDAIIENLPKDRQTLLFSATQTQNVSDLARLSLSNPEYVSVHESAPTATPITLKQFYVVTDLSQKLNHLFSFLRNNLNTKILVFMSSCKQVRFVYETFRKLHIGIPLLHLHGKQKQTARTEITTHFSQAQRSCLFATDVVARGLDFPAVNWVIQVDCPEDAATYIHRVGRTARFDKDGNSVLFLCPSELEFLKRLEAKKVPIEETRAVNNKKQDIKNNLQAMCFKDPMLKYLGQKAFVSYTKSVYIQKDREVFDIDKLPLDEFAASLGLPGTPNIVRKGKKNEGTDSAEINKVKELKNRSFKVIKELTHVSSETDEEDLDNLDPKKRENREKEKEKKGTKEVRTKYDRMFERKNQTVLTSHYTSLIKHNDEKITSAETNNKDQGDDSFFDIKRVGYDSTDDAMDSSSSSSSGARKREHKSKILKLGEKELIIDSHRRQKLVTSKKALLKYKPRGQRLVFDKNGNAHAIYEVENLESFKKAGDAEEQRRRFVEGEKEKVQKADVEDRVVAKEKRREKKERRKVREREMVEDGEDEEQGGTPLNIAPLPNIEWLDPEDMNPMEKEKKLEREEEEKRKKKQKRSADEIEGEGKRRNEENTLFSLSYKEGEQREKKRKKDKDKKSMMLEVLDEPETLEDMEKLAQGLLG